MPLADALSTPAGASAPLVSAARYIGGEVAIVRVPTVIVLALGISDGTRLLWTSSVPDVVRVSIPDAAAGWDAASDPDPVPESFFPIPTTSAVCYVDETVAVVQVPPAFAAVLALVDTARLRWAVVADRVAQVTLDPADVERVRAIREAEDDRVIEGINSVFGAFPDYPLIDD